MSMDLWNEFFDIFNNFKYLIAWNLPENSHFLLILPAFKHRENTNRSISKKAIRFLKNCFAILYHYILEYWKPLSYSLLHFVRVTSAHGTGVFELLKSCHPWEFYFSTENFALKIVCFSFLQWNWKVSK